MLDNSSLSQLQQLKKQIQASVIRSTGTVKGTTKRFGFVIDDKDGQQYLLPQSEMDLVLPGDSIAFTLEKSHSDEDKPVAKIEKLLKSELDYFIGQIKAKNNQLFIAPDHMQFNRWIFVPPQSRKNLSEGDLVAANISQHPYKFQGRAQATIACVLGKPDDPYIEHRYALAKEAIEVKTWQTDDIEAIRQTSERAFEQALENKTDLRNQVFFTIDGISTQDLDDAIALEKTAEGWLLSVAIADVSTFVLPNSPLDKVAAQQISSIYLPGQKVPMLPEVLSADLCSLREGRDRLALVCQLEINAEGAITDTRYIDAVIKSQARLNYDDVAAFLNQQENSQNYQPAIQEALWALKEFAAVRLNWRKTHAQVPEDYPDYRLCLNEKGKITQIERLERNIAQQLVEECMLACNYATALFLKAHSKQALYLNHNGFRTDQLASVGKVLEVYFPEYTSEQANQLANYCQLIKDCKSHDELAFTSIFRKKLNRSVWSGEALPHFGLGFEAYTTFTSPIRKYSDLLVHRLIKQIIQQQATSSVSIETINKINDKTQAIRNAQRDCELSLKCQYIEGFKEQSYLGTISALNHRSITVYLQEFDLHARLDLNSIGETLNFKHDTLQLNSENFSFQLEQKITVKIDQVDVNQRSVKVVLTTA